MNKVIIIGGSGLLATNWIFYRREIDNLTITLHQKDIKIDKIDIIYINFSNILDLEIKLINVSANLIINTVAISNIEYCENHPDLAELTNVDYAVFLAKFCNKHSIKFVQISTDHLFKGDTSFYNEWSFKNPLNVYGRTKSIAEDRILEIDDKSLIIRTNFFGWGTSYRRSFSDFIIDNLNQKNKIHLYSDIFYTPIHINTLIDLIYNLIEKSASGIYNIVSDDRVSKYEFGLKICDYFGFDKNLLIESSIENTRNIVKRPKDMSLSNYKLKQILGDLTITVNEQIRILHNQFLTDFHNTINEIGK